MNQLSASQKARGYAVRAVVLSLLAVTLATSLGACVYPYGRGEGEGWRHGERYGGEHRDYERR